MINLYWFLVWVLSAHTIFQLNISYEYYMTNANLIILAFYVLQKEAPVLALILTESTTKHDLRIPYYLFLSFVVVVLGYGFFSGNTFLEYTGLKWSFHAIGIYLFFGFIFFEVLRKYTTTLKALSYAFLMVASAGVLYELPIYHKSELFFYPAYLTVINPKIAGLFFLIWKSRGRIKEVLLDSRFLLALIPYFIIEGVYVIVRTNRFFNWIIRIPTLLLILLALHIYLEKRKK